MARFDRRSVKMRERLSRVNPSGGTILAVPRTPSQRIVLRVKLLRLKQEFLARNGR